MSGSEDRSSKYKKSTDDWFVSYADMITLILCFFIVIASVSKPDQAKMEQLNSSITKEVLKDSHTDATPFKTTVEKIKSVIQNKNLEGKVSIDVDPLGIKMSFASQYLFDSGSADLKENIRPILEQITNVIKTLKYNNFSIVVEGHTDNQPIHTDRFPSNWELSGSRSAALVRALSSYGIPDNQLKSVGCADTKPVAPNCDKNGNPIPQNQAANRRVVMYIQRKYD